MIKILVITLLWIGFFEVCDAQKKPTKKDIVRIQNQVNLEDYKEASENLLTLLKKHPENARLNLMYGICLLNMNNHVKDAINPLEKAKKEYGIYSKRNDYAIEANYHLAQAYHLTHQFDKALLLVQQLQDTVPLKRDKIHFQLEHLSNNCKHAIFLKKHPVDYRITNLGQAINSKYNEHSPVISGDEELLMFTSNRNRTGKKNNIESLIPEDIYTSKWREGYWVPSVNAGHPINSDDYNATCSLSPDGKTLIQYRNHGKGDLYISYFEDDKWTKPQKLPKPINSSFEESHGSLSLDGNTILFTSDRPNGVGGKDIYMSKKLPDGKWGKAIMLSQEINTPYNEESPFLSYDGKTLYFASEGHTSMGGFDIFKSELDSSANWGKAQNIGYPINTPGDDLFYIPTFDEQRVYFASERPGGYGQSDIYIIEYPISHNRALAVVSGYLFTENGQPSASSRILIRNKETGEQQGIYKPQVNSGKYTMILPTGVSYQMTVETEGKTSISLFFDIAFRSDYKSRTSATFLAPLVIKD